MPLKKWCTILKQSKNYPISQVPFFLYNILKGNFLSLFFNVICLLIPIQKLGLATQDGNCYFHSYEWVHLPLDLVHVNEQSPKASLSSLSSHESSITASYLASLTPLDHCTLNKTVTAEYFVVNIISPQRYTQVTLEAGSNRKKSLLRSRSLNIDLWDTVRRQPRVVQLI